MSRFLVISCLTILAALMLAPAASACSCVRWDPSRINQMEETIIGTVDEVRTGASGSEFGISADAKITVIRVDVAVKGEVQVGELIEVHSTTDSASCGLPFERDDKVALGLRRADGKWHSGLCDIADPGDVQRAADASNGPFAEPRLSWLDRVMEMISRALDQILNQTQPQPQPESALAAVVGGDCPANAALKV